MPIIIDPKTPNTIRVVMTDLEGVVLMPLFEDEEDAVDVEELVESRLRAELLLSDPLVEGDGTDDTNAVVEIVGDKKMDVSRAIVRNDGVKDWTEVGSFVSILVKREENVPLSRSETVVLAEWMEYDVDDEITLSTSTTSLV